jgi:uncharacterized protein (DUF697 family)
MMDTIEGCTAGLGAVGLVGGAIGPGADLPIIAPVWIGMTIALADQAGSAMDKETAKKIVYATATGVGSFVAGSKIAATVAGWLFAIPSGGLSLGLCMAGNAFLNGKLTHAYGKAVALYFLQTEGLDDGDLTVQVLIALVAVQMGLPSGNPDVIA